MKKQTTNGLWEETERDLENVDIGVKKFLRGSISEQQKKEALAGLSDTEKEDLANTDTGVQNYILRREQ